MSSSEVNEALAQGLTQAARQQSVPLPLERFSVSDGGEGFLAMVAQGRDVQQMPPFSVTGPDGKRLSVPWIKQQNVAFIESAHVVGHACVNPSGNPLAYSSYGLGEVLAGMAQHHPEVCAIYVGLGSSAIVDGGMGALAALGARFYNRQGEVLSPHLSALSQLHSLTPPRCILPPVHWVADVNNSICGPRSGLRAYGPQKGLSARQIEHLTADMAGWWRLLWKKGRWDSGGERLAFHPWLQQRYRGAAGGVGMGVSAFYGGRWHDGSQWCIEHLELDQRLRLAAGLIVGEGCFDRGSLEGKITGALIGLARELDKPVIGVFGQIEPEMKQNYLWEKQAYSDSSHAFKPEKEATRQWLMRCGSDLLTAFEYAFEGRNVLKDIEQNQYKQDGQEDL